MSENAETPANLIPAKDQLVDPRTISKIHDPEGRQNTAQTIQNIRQEEQHISSNIAGSEQKLDETHTQVTELMDAETQNATALTDRLRSWIVQIKEKVGLSDSSVISIRQEIHNILNQKNTLIEQGVTIRNELDKLSQQQAGLPSGRELLDAYYEKIATTPLTQEEKRRLLKAEVLSELSMDEYIRLWKRLNPHFLTHVTRQGFRDHNAMMYHSAGMEEFHDGFTNTLADNKMMRTKFPLHGLKGINEQAVSQYEFEWVVDAPTEEASQKKFDNLLHFSMGSAPKYADESSLHFGAQIALNHYYGAETGNEIMYVYPTDVLASQYNFGFNGWEHDFTRPQSEDKWNDVFVFPEDAFQGGIPLNAGIVFLPENTSVDPQTGSKYASKIENIDGKDTRVLIIDTPTVDSFLSWFPQITPDSKAGELISYLKSAKDGMGSSLSITRNAFTQEFKKELENLGFHPDAAMALAYKLSYDIRGIVPASNAEQLSRLVEESGAHWKRAENTVLSKQYWEDFFNKNPEQKPRHIHFYTGDPTTAIYEFQQKHNIGQADTSATDGKLLGFEDHYIAEMGSDPRSNKGHDELMEIGKKLVSEHFKKKNHLS